MDAINFLSREQAVLQGIPFKDAVALGQVPFWRGFRKFGMNDGVPASGMEEMWPVGTVKVWPSAAAVASTVSDDAADDGAGTGTRTLVIEGLDASFNEVSETITMDGVTPVLTTQTFLRINRAYGLTAGSGGVNAGNISISVGGDLQAYVEAMEGQTHQTHYTVPAGHVLIVDNFTIGVGRLAGSADCHVASSVRDATSANPHWRAISDVYLYQSIHQNDGSSTVIPAKYDITQTIASTAATQAFSVYSGYLVKQ